VGLNRPVAPGLAGATLTNEAWRHSAERSRGMRMAPSAILGALPPPALILAGIVSVQVGAGLAKQLFPVIPPAAVTLLRLWTSAVVMLVPVIVPRLRRARGAPGGPAPVRPPRAPSLLRLPGLRPGRPGEAARPAVSWRSLGVAAAFGLTLAAMNFAIYQSFARIPLGVAVTIEFLGPLGVAVAASRRLIDLGFVVLAASGVALLTGGGGHVTVIGVVFALVAAVCWAAYILLSAETGRRFPGSTGLTVAMVVAAIAITPVGAVAGGTAIFRPGILAIGAGIGLLSSVIPYTLELEALRRMPPRVFGILMSLEPAVAALVGLVLLGQLLTATQWIAIGCVMAACIGATRGASAGRLEA
jgi:inner membrane transporter RhtA